MSNNSPIKSSLQPNLNIVRLEQLITSEFHCISQEIVVELDEHNEESLMGGSYSSSGDVTITATENNTLSAIALPSFLNQANKGKQ